MKSNTHPKGILQKILLTVMVLLLVITSLFSDLRKISMIIVIIGIAVEFIYMVVQGKRGWSFGLALALGFITGTARFILYRITIDTVSVAIGIAALSTGLSWILLFIVFSMRWKTYLWWTLLPGGILSGTAASFLLSNRTLLEFVFYIGLGAGISMLIWGVGRKLFGLLISGSILLTSAAGIGFAWNLLGLSDPVSQTGIMLVWLGLGWVLITIVSKVIREAFIWWPLIPGGILLMVGLGLYLGANPSYAGGILSNSTIMSILIFGAYIFFYRMSIKK